MVMMIMVLVLFSTMVMIMGNDDYHPGGRGHNQEAVVGNFLSSYEVCSQLCSRKTVQKIICTRRVHRIVILPCSSILG